MIAPPPPALPARYRFTGDCFAGGQGYVYRCRDQNIERDVAIKFIQNVADLAALRNEMNALRDIRSDNVVEIYDILEYDHGSQVALVVEFVPGHDLLHTISTSGPLVIRNDLIRALYQIASGIADIHEVGIVNRDIKLNNMKTIPGGIIKIFDLGLAKNVNPYAPTVGFKGTPGFAAPELYYPPYMISAAADVFALGACAWLLACGNLPVELQQSPPNAVSSSMITARPDLPSEIASIIDACLWQNPQGRPTSAAVRDQLRRHLVAGRHQGLLAYNQTNWVVSQVSRSVKINLGLGEAIIRYDDAKFALTPVSGSVYINGGSISAPTELPGASVITFGSPEYGNRRKFVTFDISHPEVTL